MAVILLFGIACAVLLTAGLGVGAFVDVAFGDPSPIVQQDDDPVDDVPVFVIKLADETHVEPATVPTGDQPAMRRHHQRLLKRTTWLVDIFLLASADWLALYSLA